MVDSKILKIMRDHRKATGFLSMNEWEIAERLYLDWGNWKFRAKRGAWIRVIVQALWRLNAKGKVCYFFQPNGTRCFALR